MTKYKKLVYIGVGETVSLKRLKALADSILLIDGSADVVKRRLYEANNDINISVVQRVIAPTSGNYNFYCYNNPDFNGIEPVCSTTEQLYPGIQLESEQSVSTISLQDCIDEIGMLGTGTLLIIDLPISSLDTTGLYSTLSTVDDVVLPEHIYQAVLKDAPYKPIALKLAGLANEPFNNLTIINAFSSQAENYERLTSLKNEAFAHKTALDIKENEYAALVNKLRALSLDKENLESEGNELKNELLRLKESKRIEQVLEKLTSATESNALGLNALEANLSSQNKIIDASIKNATSQIECYVALDRFMANGGVSLAYHGWPLSTDISLYLVNKIQAEKPDHIIEFGSGTSTCLFANAAKHFYRDSHEKRVTSFEHSHIYHEKTIKLLSDKKLNEYVNLVHAPLVEKSEEDRVYQYYDCQEELLEFKRNSYSGRTLLVLVDGPPAVTCELARYPGLPLIIESTNFSSIEFVLDDFNRREEKDVLNHWEKYLQAKNILFEKETIPCEKGALILRVSR